MKTKLLCVVAALAGAICVSSVGAVKAATFYIDGDTILSGYIDIVNGSVTGGSLNLHPNLSLTAVLSDTFNVLVTQTATCCRTDYGVSTLPQWSVSFNDALNGADGGYQLTLVFNTGADPSSISIPPLGTLADFTGGYLRFVQVIGPFNGGAANPLNLNPGGFPVYAFDGGAVCGSPDFGICNTSNTTPIPSALPLFATGLGALGLLGWRRKRKNVAAIAAA